MSALAALVNAAVFETARWLARRAQPAARDLARSRPRRARRRCGLRNACASPRSTRADRRRAGAARRHRAGEPRRAREAARSGRACTAAISSRRGSCSPAGRSTSWSGPRRSTSRGIRGPFPVSGDLIRARAARAAALRRRVGAQRGRAAPRLQLGAPDRRRRHDPRRLRQEPAGPARRVRCRSPSCRRSPRCSRTRRTSAPARETPPLTLGAVAHRDADLLRGGRAGLRAPHGARARGRTCCVTLANDAWFGDSQEPWLHLAVARLRAIEHRRYLVRATNSGVSAIVDPAGRMSRARAAHAARTCAATVHPLDGETLYAPARRLAGLAREREPARAPCCPGQARWSRSGFGCEGEVGLERAGSPAEGGTHAFSRPRAARAGTARRRRELAREVLVHGRALSVPHQRVAQVRARLDRLREAQPCAIGRVDQRRERRAAGSASLRSTSNQPSPMRPFITTRTRIAPRAARAGARRRPARASSCVEVARQQAVDAELARALRARGARSPGSSASRRSSRGAARRAAP